LEGDWSNGLENHGGAEGKSIEAILNVDWGRDGRGFSRGKLFGGKALGGCLLRMVRFLVCSFERIRGGSGSV